MLAYNLAMIKCASLVFRMVTLLYVFGLNGMLGMECMIRVGQMCMHEQSRTNMHAIEHWCDAPIMAIAIGHCYGPCIVSMKIASINASWHCYGYLLLSSELARL
jgi:hypothetical protein